VAGQSLSTRLASGELPSIADAVSILRDVADALAHAHAQGVVHRDVKPGNVLLSEGHALVMDFGIAKSIRDAARSDLTQPGLALGTPAYMAPEQAGDNSNVDHRADLYALGALGYALLTGEPPFRGSPMEQMVAHAIREPDPVGQHRPDVPDALAQLLMTCLRKDPAHRWQSSGQIRAELDRVMGRGSTITGARDVGAQWLPGAGGADAVRRAAALETGRDAFARQDWAAAFEHLTAAGELGPDDLVRLADSAWWLGRGNECVRTRERAYAAYVQRGNARGAAASAIALAEDYYHWRARSVGQGWLRRAERHLAELPESAEHGWLARLRATLAFEVERDFPRALALSDEVAAIAQRLGDRDLQALALQDRGRILVAQGDVAQGMSLIDDAMAAAAAGELGARTTGRAYCNMMTACEQIADYRRAAEWNNASLHWCEPHAESAYPGICRVHRAELLRLRGAFLDAESEARRAAEQVGDLLPEVAGQAYYELAEVRLRMGDFERAEALFREAHRRGRHPVPGLALLRLAQGQAEAGRSLIDRALGERTILPLERARLLPARVELAIACGTIDQARTGADELAAIATLYQSSALGAAAVLARGMVELAEGTPADAAVTLRRARALWTEIELPYEAARTRVALARAYQALGNWEEAALELDAAAVVFEMLGALADLGKLVELRGGHHSAVGA
jgi:tetratricopeptide (TPR) repeat protein